MVKKTKKNQRKINGNTFTQQFENIQFVKDYKAWKDNCEGVSGEAMGVENIPTLWDFLDKHIIAPFVRDESVNSGKDDGSEGALTVLDGIESIMEGEVIEDGEIDDLQKLYDYLREIEDNKGPGDLQLDPKRIFFTDRVYDDDGKVVGTEDVFGHYKTKNYVKGRKLKNKDYAGEAVDEGWYSGTGNPPSFALFGGNATFAKPKGLVQILDDALKALKPSKGKPAKTQIDVEIVNLSGRNAINKLAGVASVERYFDKAINNQMFWAEKSGKLLVNKLLADVKTKQFEVSPKEENAVKEAAGAGDKTPAGRIKTFKINSTGTPIIRFIQAALQRANKKKAPDGYRAWTSGKQFDYRKTAKEVFGEDTGRYAPDAKVISKSWAEILKQGFTDQELDALLNGMADHMEMITEKMFMDGYKSGFYDFDNFWVDIEDRTFSRAKGPAFNYTFAYRKPPDYVPSGDTLIFAEVLIAGTEDGKINDVFFNTSDSKQQIKDSFTFMRLPNIRSIMRRWARELSEFKRKIMG